MGLVKLVVLRWVIGATGAGVDRGGARFATLKKQMPERNNLRAQF
jgi:hypothetical protein